MVLLYGEDGDGPKVSVLVQDETICLTQKQLSELFECAVENINFHLKNIYSEGELFEGATIKEFLIVRQEGVHHQSFCTG